MKRTTPKIHQEPFQSCSGQIRGLVLLALLVCVGTVRAQEVTNFFQIAPATKLEAFDTNIGTIIIKATTDLGVVAANAAAVSVKYKEFRDTATGRKEHGLAIEITRPGQFKDVMLIDYDELASLLNAIDYFNKVDVSVSSLDSFDAAYTTKGGFRIAALGTRRTGLVQFGVRDIRISAPPVVLTREEMTRLSSLVNQAKSQLDGLRG